MIVEIVKNPEALGFFGDLDERHGCHFTLTGYLTKDSVPKCNICANLEALIIHIERELGLI